MITALGELNDKSDKELRRLFRQATRQKDAFSMALLNFEIQERHAQKTIHTKGFVPGKGAA